MILCVYPVDRFGWSSIEENPVYGTIRFENKPTTEQTIENLSDPQRTRAYRNNVECMVVLLKQRNVPIVLGTMAFRPEKIATYGILTDEPDVFEALCVQLERNNQAIRDVAEAHGVPVAETVVLNDEADLFFDDVHMSEEGHVRRAEIFFTTIQEHGLLTEDKAISRGDN